MVDTRLAAPEISSAEIRTIVASLALIGPRMEGAPIAVIVPSDLAFGLVRMIGLLLDDRLHIVPFRDPSAAAAWLTATMPAPPPAA
jgi:hypothetical protein